MYLIGGNNMQAIDLDRFAFIKPSLDAHTLGVNSAVELLRDCDYEVLVADETIARAMNDIKYETNQKAVIEWIKKEGITRIGISYRLDEDDAISIVGYFMKALSAANLLDYQGGQVKSLFFAGLPHTCEVIEGQHKGFVKTFKGGESIGETLTKMGVPASRIPKDIIEGSISKLYFPSGDDALKLLLVPAQGLPAAVHIISPECCQPFGIKRLKASTG